MKPAAGDKEWRGGQAAPEPVLVKMICYVCGSEDLSVEKCKVWCKKCRALIENCSGD